MENTDLLSRSPRSAFVTVVAWIFIFLGGIASAGSLMQNIIFFKLSALAGVHEPMHAGMEQMPLPVRLIFEHFQFYLGVVLIVSFSGLASAVGLLKRKNWARLVFIGVLGVGIVGLLVGFATQLSFAPVTGNIPAAQVPRDVQTMLRVMKGFLFILTFSVTLLVGWLIARLSSSEIRREFLGR